jgi:hypothetical protein
MKKDINTEFDIINVAVHHMDLQACRPIVRQVFNGIARRKIKERYLQGADVVLSEIGEKFQSYMDYEKSKSFFDLCSNAGIDARKPKSISINTQTVGTILESVKNLNKKEENVHTKKGKSSLREEW